MSDTDEPAFPQDAQTGNLELWRQGMSLRDYFAGQALAALADLDETEPGVIAGFCYQVADAMLKARAE